MRVLQRKWWQMAGSVAAALLVISGNQAMASEVVATVGDLAGFALIERGGVKYTLAVGVPLHAGDTIHTGNSGRVRVLFKDNSVLSVGRKSQVEIAAMNPAANRSFDINVLVGRFKMDVAKWFRGTTDGIVRTPTSVAGVRGTVLWGDTEIDAVCALEGTITLAPISTKKEVTLSNGQCRGGMGQGKLDKVEPTAEMLEGFLKEFDIP